MLRLFVDRKTRAESGYHYPLANGGTVDLSTIGTVHETTPYPDVFHLNVAMADPLEPIHELPDFAHGVVFRATFAGVLHGAFRADGLYRHQDAELLLRTERNRDGHLRQECRASARSFKDLREIYRLVRTGQLPPAENYEATELVGQRVGDPRSPIEVRAMR